MRQLLDTMRANMDGIRHDIDTEFLHDFRVAVRRTRSALSQVKQVFPERTARHFSQEFRFLGQATNALRDLDVYLLAEPEYRSLLPDALQDDIAPLFEYLRSQRSQAHADVVQVLDSAATIQMLSDWDTLLNLESTSANSASAMNAAVPIHILSQQRIYGRYAHILKKGRPLLKNAEDEKLHSLRIACKKLRYLLEFFASLYPEDDVQRLISDLRRLQDNLGEFNDLSVQQAYLVAVAQELSHDDVRTAPALVATGALVEKLASLQLEVKGEFADRFRAFASKQNQALYRELFTVTATYTDNS